MLSFNKQLLEQQRIITRRSMGNIKLIMSYNARETQRSLAFKNSCYLLTNNFSNNKELSREDPWET